jgi:hypothetical protein
MTVFVVAALTWLVTVHTPIPLGNGKLVHLSYLGWPLAFFAVGAGIGFYIFLAATQRWMPIYGRRYDESSKYALTFNGMAIQWELSPDFARLGARVALRLGNGGSTPIQVYIERLGVTINAIAATLDTPATRRLRLLPNQIRECRAPTLRDIPFGNVQGTMSYAISYGPVSGAPVYRRTHKIYFTVDEPITLAGIRAGVTGTNDWTDLDEEKDEDMPDGYVPSAS